jgi:hypothetical protein
MGVVKQGAARSEKRGREPQPAPTLVDHEHIRILKPKTNKEMEGQR